MALSSILEKIQQKGTIKHVYQEKPTLQPPGAAQSLWPLSSRERVVDPVVARLKAARKAEKEQKEALLREKKGLAPRKKPVPATIKQPPQVTNPGAKSIRKKDTKTAPSLRGVSSLNPRPQNTELARPKMSFTELMQKASSIDQSKLSIQLKGAKTAGSLATDSSSKENAKKINPLKAYNAGALSTQNLKTTKVIPKSTNNRSHGGLENKQNGSMRAPLARAPGQKGNLHSSNKVDDSKRLAVTAPQQRAPLPIRKPSSQLQARLQKSGRSIANHRGNHKESDRRAKRHNGFNNSDNDDDDDDEGDDDDDLDSFIASDEEVDDVGADYDREEIWSMFNRGRKRVYYNGGDSDSDDMEATGAEILAEEARSKRDALEEDKREQAEEERLAALKRARKIKHSG